MSFASPQSTRTRIPTTLVPANYTPVAVQNEGTNKVSAHLKGIDNALASAAGKFVREIREFSPDSSAPASLDKVGNLNVVAFSGSTSQIAWLQFVTDARLDDTADLTFEIVYRMSASESSKGVSLNADVWVFSDADDPTKAADVSGQEDELSTPNDTNLKKQGLTNIKVPLANLSGSGQVIQLKLWRNPGDTGDTHSGYFQLVSFRAYQS